MPNLSALLVGTIIPISPMLAVMLNNGSSLVAAANAMRVLGFRSKDLPPANLETVAPVHAVHQGSGPEAEPVDPSSNPAPSSTAVLRSRSSVAVSLVELSSRLSLKHQAITARRRRADFAHWVRSHDPEGHSWSYCSQTKMYLSIVA